MSITSNTRAAARRTRCSVCVAAGRPADELEGDERDQREAREQHAVEPPGVHRRDADRAASPTSPSPQQQARQALADARRARARRGDARELRVGGERALELLAGAAPLTTSSSAPSIRSTTLRGQLRARRCLARLAAGGERCPVSHGTSVAASDQRARSRISPAAGSITHTSATVAAPTPSAIANGGSDAQQQVLQRVDVVHEAREQIAAAKRRQTERREALQARRRGSTLISASTRKAASWPTSRSP